MFVFFLDLAPPSAVPAPLAIVPHICDGFGLDLDGDGKPEPTNVVPDTRGTGGAVFEVFVGDRKVGEIPGCWFRRGDKRHHGLYDIVATWRLGARDYPQTHYRFDGRRYRATGKPTPSHSE